MSWLRLFVGLTGAVALAATTMAVGCSGQGAGPEDASIDSLGVQMEPEGGDEEASTDAGSGLETTMRLANLSPDLGPVDFCWRTSGATSFTGPVLGSTSDGGGTSGFTSDAAADSPETDGATGEDDAASGNDAADATLDSPADAPSDGAADARHDARAEGGSDAATDADADAPATSGDGGDAAAAGLGFGQVTGAVTLPAAGTFDVGIVAAGTLSCAAPRFIGRVTLDAGKTGTVVVFGLAGAPAGGDADAGDASTAMLAMTNFIDEPPSAGAAAVRFIHAALGWPGGAAGPGALSVSSGDVTLAPEVLPGQATAPSLSPSVDTLGYLDATPVTTAAPFLISSVGDAAPRRTWTTAFLTPGLLPGTSHTGFLVSLANGDLGVVWCGDVGSAPGAPSSCVMLPAP